MKLMTTFQKNHLFALICSPLLCLNCFTFYLASSFLLFSCLCHPCALIFTNEKLNCQRAERRKKKYKDGNMQQKGENRLKEAEKKSE